MKSAGTTKVMRTESFYLMHAIEIINSTSLMKIYLNADIADARTLVSSSGG